MPDPSNREVLRGTIKTSDIGTHGEGLIGPEQFDAFHELAKYEDRWADEQRTEMLSAHEGGIPRIDFGDDIIHPRQESVDNKTYNEPDHDFIPYRMRSGDFDFKLTQEAASQAANTPRYESQLIDGFTRAWARSKQKMYWLGDEDSPEPMLSLINGWFKTIVGGGLTVDGSAINSGDLEHGHFQACFSLLPEAWKQRTDMLRWAISATQKSNYLDSLADRATGGGDVAHVQDVNDEIVIKGVRTTTVPFLTDRIALVSPTNTIEVVDRNGMTMEREDRGHKAKKERTVFYFGSFYFDAVMSEVEGAAAIENLNP